LPTNKMKSQNMWSPSPQLIARKFCNSYKLQHSVWCFHHFL